MPSDTQQTITLDRETRAAVKNKIQTINQSVGPLFALFSLGRPTFDASMPTASLLTAEVALRELCEILGIETDGIRVRTQLLGELHAAQQQVRGLEAQIAFAANANGTQARGRG